MTTTQPTKRLTAAEVAELCAVSIETVFAWIASGELRAAQLGKQSTSRKPRWRIKPEDLAAFEESRTPEAAPPITSRQRRKPLIAAKREWFN